MSRNSRNRHKGNGPAAKGAPGSQASGSVSLSTFRAGRALDALTPAFVQWFDDGSPGAAAAAVEYLKQVEPVMGRYLDSTAAAEVTGFEPVPLAIAISDEVAATADASAAGLSDVEDAVFVVDAVHAYVEFLSETGRWSGSAEQLAGVSDFFDTIVEDDDEPGYLDVPDIPEEQALEVFSGLPLIQRATALLRWIGAGRPVTGTGALRLRDIEAAAACVGVTVRGNTKRADSALPGTADAVPTVRSMYEVPLLAQMWAALEAAELIEIRSTKVVPFEDSKDFLAGGTSERLEEFFLFTACFLEQAVVRYDPDQPWEKIIAGLETSILIAAATAEPPLVERVLAAPDHAPGAEKKIAVALTSAAVRRLEALAELGLLTIDTHFRVPPALIGCVADTFDNDRVLADLGLGEAPDDAAVGPAIADTTAPGAALAAPQPAPQSILQLKIMLNDSKPPIWRRALVPAGMPLPQLHAVIQALFGWLDYHLHQFQTGGFRGPTYAPVDPDGEDDFYGEPSRDESKVTLGELLPAVGSTMTYTYDFGDNWVHGIKVEKILAADDGGGQLPRCTAGRGAAPAEDSGGIWGWENIVQAVNDPRHEEYQEYREWLGLRGGETLDPKAFDVEQANETLADLF
ncbi:plasmid pRiA4b ORF-3 family protein [Pseudarthrobacter albicanus]|uniref:plasmid pRiA4b ORF-3 family protein n=1 Tax=Pseudarthrobacter albicanus TaxID=2823873 RepID=UPI001BA7725B|nr:plasmid pRiA4b ORF-3 family protein [Pseudarthrobacter albicanus]